MPYIIIGVIVVIVVAIIVVVFFTKGDVSHTASKLIDEDRIEEAIALLEPLSIKEPENANYHYLLAKCHEIYGNNSKALEHYNEVKKQFIFLKNANLPLVLRKIADIHLQEGRSDSAFETLLLLLSINAKDSYANSHVGYMALGQGNFAVAEGYLQKALAEDLGNEKLQLAIAICKHENNDPSCIEVFQNLAKNDSHSDYLFYWIIALITHKPAEGIKKIEETLSKFKDSYLQTICVRLIAYWHYRQKREKDAIGVFEKLLKVNSLAEEVKLEIRYYSLLFWLQLDNFLAAKPFADSFVREGAGYKSVDLLVSYLNRAASQLSNPPKDEFEQVYEKTFGELIPQNLLFTVSGLQTKDTILFEKYFDVAGQKVSAKAKYLPITEENFRIEFLSLSPADFFAFCEFTIQYLGNVLVKAVEQLNPDEAFYLTKQSKEKPVKEVVVFTRWKEEARFSDIFIENCVSVMKKNYAESLQILTSSEITEKADEKLQKYSFIKIRDMTKLLEYFQLWKFYNTGL